MSASIAVPAGSPTQPRALLWLCLLLLDRKLFLPSTRRSCRRVAFRSSSPRTSPGRNWRGETGGQKIRRLNLYSENVSFFYPCPSTCIGTDLRVSADPACFVPKNCCYLVAAKRVCRIRLNRMWQKEWGEVTRSKYPTPEDGGRRLCGKSLRL